PHPGARPGLGAGGLTGPGRPGPGRPGRGPAGRGRRPPPARPVPGGHPRLVVRRLPGRPGRAAPPPPAASRRSSLLADAAKLERPLLLIHGLADDNVVAAHTLRLSGLLLV